jgi:hypothetical protein
MDFLPTTEAASSSEKASHHTKRSVVVSTHLEVGNKMLGWDPPKLKTKHITPELEMDTLHLEA